jgi:GH35 family endo-1,4-beta-xylanase
VIGLQLYYPDQDLFEIDRLLERFSQLGKPIHITELGVSSSMQKDEESYFKEPTGLWHSPWSETVQADWIEQFYTICYSKNNIQAITWWDLVDGGSFIPYGGLLREDMTPKLGFYRLQKLFNQWRV